MKAIYNEGSVGENLVVKEIPAEYQDQAEEYREKLIELLQNSMKTSWKNT